VIGCDIVNIERFEEFAHKNNLSRIFTPEELAYSKEFTHQRARAGCLAKRFAAKEAFIKALGKDKFPCILREIGISKDKNGKPYIELSGETKNNFEKYYKNCTIELTLSDDYPMAMAVVIIC